MYDQIQDNLSKVSEDLKFSMQKQAGLEEHLSIKEKELENMQGEL